MEMPKMTIVEVAELMDKLRLASDRELAAIYASVKAPNPFAIPEHKDQPRDKIRELCVKQIVKWIEEGLIAARKN